MPDTTVKAEWIIQAYSLGDLDPIRDWFEAAEIKVSKITLKTRFFSSTGKTYESSFFNQIVTDAPVMSWVEFQSSKFY